ncbi:MAG: hypothetical protein JW827_00450 [Spirochaetes bacterium]|nr:hypothetical protein [Spirochaetota bacterium]
MQTKFSEEELSGMVQKLRKEYDELAEQYGTNLFNKKKFEERYIQALKNKVDLQSFIYAEVQAVRDIKRKIELKEEEERIKKEKPITRKIEKFIAQLEEKIKKYHPLFTDVEISDEAQHFCGALDEFYNHYWIILDKILGKSQPGNITKYIALSGKIQRFIHSTKDHLPYEVEQYIININKFGIEKANMMFLKEGAILLREINNLLRGVRIEDDEEEIIFKIAEKSSTKVEALKIIIDYIDEIIDNFRFSGFI